MSILNNKRGKIFLVVSVYWVVSITTVFINKLLLTGNVTELDAPLFVTWFQCLVSSIFYFICYLNSKNSSKVTHTVSPMNLTVIRAVMPLSLVFVLMIMLNNLCLKYVGVSFYYIGRSLTTVFNVLLTYVVLKERTSFSIIACCNIIVCGFLMGVDQEHDFGTLSLFGTLCGIFASLALAYYSIKIKAVLSYVDNMIWILSYYNNVYSCIILLPVIVVSGEMPILYYYSNWGSLDFWVLMIISGFCGLAIGFVTALQIKVTSPLTHNISGTAKACAQTVIATVYYNEHKSWLWWISNILVLGGSAAYSIIRQRELEKTSPPSPLLKY